jgi:hypothetical protein
MRGRVWSRAAYLAIVVLFLATYWFTSPDYIGDTTRYAADAIGHAAGQETQFWEFGHLLWRPYGYVGYSLFGNYYAQTFGGTSNQSVIRFLMHTNFVCSIGTLLLLLFLFRKAADMWIAVAVVFGLSCTTPFLNYSHSGAPYIPALLFSALTFSLLTAAAERSLDGRRFAVLAGVSFTVATGLWFPFSISGLGMLAALYLVPMPDSGVIHEHRPLRRRLMAWFLLSLAASTLVLFAAAAAAKGVRNLAQLWQWVLESDNAWSQSQTAMRAATGLARSVWNFGEETILLKRWLFSDPYNPVSAWTVIPSLGVKLAVFYLGLGATAWVLWKQSRPVLYMLVAAGLPLLLFAVVLFEPSSPERFLPLFPFAGLAFAAVLDKAGRHIVASACVAVLLAGSVVVNLEQQWKRAADARFRETTKRLQTLNNNVQPGALVFLVTFRDDLYRLPELNPLDQRLAASHFRVVDAIEIASRRIMRWRAEFAEQAQEQWARNGEVWVSERLLAPRPQPHWHWVEGDDQRIRWSELPATFGQLDFDAKVLAGSDGFLRLARTQTNHDRLAKERTAR